MNRRTFLSFLPFAPLAAAGVVAIAPAVADPAGGFRLLNEAPFIVPTGLLAQLQTRRFREDELVRFSAIYRRRELRGTA